MRALPEILSRIGLVLRVGLVRLWSWGKQRSPHYITSKLQIGRFVWLGLAIVWLWFNGATASLAETPQTEPPISEMHLEQPAPNRPGLDADDISSEKVSQFVQAYLQVLSLSEAKEEELQSAETEPDSLKIEQDVEAEALAILESVDLTWQEYLQLRDLANIDPEFGERIAAQLQEADH
jgi:hypothetical protein